MKRLLVILLTLSVGLLMIGQPASACGAGGGGGAGAGAGGGGDSSASSSPSGDPSKGPNGFQPSSTPIQLPQGTGPTGITDTPGHTGQDPNDHYRDEDNRPGSPQEMLTPFPHMSGHADKGGHAIGG